MDNRNKKGRGSVSRSFRYLRRKEKDPNFYKKILENSSDYEKRRKKRVNNRCIDCKKLICSTSIRCEKCNYKRKKR
jgi:hypothetical protein